MSSPFTMPALFTTAARAFRDEAAAALVRSPLGQLTKAARGGAVVGRNAVNLKRALGKYSMGPDAILRELMGAEFGRLTSQISRYARGPSGSVLRDFLGSLGPAGKIIEALSNSRATLDDVLGLAANVLRSHGDEWLPGPGRGTPADRARAIEASKAFLESEGYKITQPAQRKPIEQPIPEEERVSGGGANQQANFDKRFPRSHPINSGEMVQVTPRDTERHGPGSLYSYFGVTPAEFLSLYRTADAGSSNVHSFGYDYPGGILYVRFLAPGKSGPADIFGTTGGGDATPGNWVWDHLRQRGTVSGHKKDYRLAGVMAGYVPRKATLTARGEEFIKRNVKTNQGRWLRSSRPDELVRPLRAEPNRGRPNTGRP